jgi:hypothetical protein
MVNIERVIGPEAFAAMFDTLPDNVITGRDGFKTARALFRSGQLALAHRFLQRRLALGATDWRTRWMAWRAAAQPGVRG